MNLLIKNGDLVNPGKPKLNGKLDLLVKQGKIAKIGENLKAGKGCQVIDATRQYVFPGLVDLHVHLREPGHEYKEDIASGTKAAARGGFTTINCMPNTEPPIDNRSVVEFVREVAKASGVIRVVTTACITKGRAGKELVEMADLYEAGVRTLSDDGDMVEDAHLMRRALEYAGMFPLTIISHAEVAGLSRGGDMNEGFVSTKLGLKGIPAAAEEIAVARDIRLAELAKARLHLAHLSTTGSIELLRTAQKRGLPITGEVTPHHFTLTDEETVGYDTSTKVNPPLRERQDVLACVRGIEDGTISCIATDHAPHAGFEKEREYSRAPFGISGLETAVSLAFTELHLKHKIPLATIIAALTINPARILALDIGTLAENGPASLTIFDPNLKWRVEPSAFLSKGKSTPFAGRELTGRVSSTIYNGRLVYQFD